MPRIRVASWNVNGRADVASQMEILDGLGWDLLLLQEVRPRAVGAFRSHPGVAQIDTALAYLPERAQVKQVVWGCGIVVANGVVLDRSAPLAVPSPERSLIGVARLQGVEFEVAALAAPPASSGWGRQKVDQVLAFADRFAQRRLPMIVGVDANTPKYDHRDLAQVEWWWPEEAQVWGHEARHGLRDVFRDHLQEELEQDGRLPLATSHLRGHRKTPCRYDFLFASPEIEALQCRYIWDAKVRANSDHAIVWAELQLS